MINYIRQKDSYLSYLYIILLQGLTVGHSKSTLLQVRWGFEDNSETLFFISQQKHVAIHH